VFGHDYPTADGTCVRDYIHVADLATAHLLALEATGQSAGLCTAYNLGGGRGYSVREIIETASRVTGRRIATRMCPRRPGDPAVLIASSDRIKSALDWRPRFDQIDAIIESAWRWMTRSGRA
jgi:UDP-glucose 4-epimerase